MSNGASPISAVGCSAVSGAAVGARSIGGSWTAASIRVTGGCASGVGAQLRQRPSTAFQQSLHVYCRHDRQKLKVRWKASSAVAVERCSFSERATAKASSSDDPGSVTKCRIPRPSVPMADSGFRRLSTGSKV